MGVSTGAVVLVASALPSNIAHAVTVGLYVTLAVWVLKGLEEDK